MTVIQATIDSELRKKGQIYQASDEVEQQLTISENGTVILHAISHEGLPCWQEEKKVDKEVCQNMLALLDQYASDPVFSEQEEAGQWKMTLIYEDNSRVELTGPMIGHVSANDVDLTEYIRKQLPFMSLGVFDTTDSL